MKSVIALLACCLFVSCARTPEGPMSPGAFPPVPVSVATAQREAVPIELNVVGTAEPFSTVEIKSQVAGPLLRVRFAEGATVSQGDLLFEIDSRPFRDALRQAEAVLARDEAQLRQAEANAARSRAQLKNADAENARFEQLAREGISTRMQQDQIRTAADVARESLRADEAAIETTRASLDSSRTAVDRAKLDLSYCEIRSPISGRTGNLLVHPGNLVKANGDTPLVVINQVTPIFVSFGVPERHLTEISRKAAARKLTVEVATDDDGGVSRSGTLTVVDNAVDRNTGTIRLKASLPNTDRALWPGQFVNVTLRMDTLTAVVIPAESVQAGQQGPFVYVVKPDQTVEPRPLVVGRTVGGKVIVEKGIEAGETVVSDGQSRLFPGAKIQTQPAGEAKPAPAP